uniref:Uncharacterized protein n=1 Tax=Leersia perrieri TaxID=77586 RepID=A0A0D9WKN1_9ORYZ
MSMQSLLSCHRPAGCKENDAIEDKSNNIHLAIALPDIYPLTGLQIGDMQSYVSRAFVYFAPVSKKLLILVDNQPWRTDKQSRSARVWQFMVTKYRMSPFANSRAVREEKASAAAAAAAGAEGPGGWFEVADGLSLAGLHGFLVFEVSWRDVHGINYLNDLLTDTSLALEARYMKKWEFYSAEQAARCAPLAQESESSSESSEQVVVVSDTLLLLRFSDSAVPEKLRQIIMSDIRLLTLLESGLPAWVIFLQSYPLLCLLYRPWMRPLARTLYLLASLSTLLIGFYDLYKNVPLLKAAAARLCGPLFGWIETWDMLTRIQYLGTILFLRNHLRKILQALLALLRMARALLRPLASPLLHLFDLLADTLWSPLDALLDFLHPLLQSLLLPLRLAASLASFAGSLLSHTYNFGKDIWETLSSMLELNHMAEAHHSALDVSLLKTLWNDLFSQIFRAIRSILNGVLVFFASCNRHRLSIYNHMQARLRHMLHVARLTHYSCPCKMKRRLQGQSGEDDVVECDICK